MRKKGETELLDAGIFKVADIELMNDKGEEIHHKAIRFVETVSVLPVSKDGTIWLERQYRSAIDKTVIEIPAGKMDAGETPEQCAARELEEETGMRIVSLSKRFQAFITFGYSDEYMYYFRAVVEPVPDAERSHFQDPDEEIELFGVTAEQARTMVTDGTIEDSKTILLLLDYLATWNE